MTVDWAYAGRTDFYEWNPEGEPTNDRGGYRGGNREQDQEREGNRLAARRLRAEDVRRDRREHRRAGTPVGQLAGPGTRQHDLEQAEDRQDAVLHRPDQVPLAPDDVPDGGENRSPKGTKTLVLPYDRNHSEIEKEMRLAGIPDEAAVCRPRSAGRDRGGPS